MKKDITANIPEEAKVPPQELDLDELDKVTGAGDPFADTPRNPEQPIDDDLRDNA